MNKESKIALYQKGTKIALIKFQLGKKKFISSESSSVLSKVQSSK